MSDIPAGWQPDPRGRHEYRYWDGSQWTDHVSDQGQVSQDPVADASPPAAGGGTGATSAAEPPAAAEPTAVTEPAAVEPDPVPTTDAGAAPVIDEPAAHHEPEPVVHREPEPAAAAAAGPVAASSAPPGGTATAPASGQTEARAAADEVLRGKSPEIGTILSAVIPGSGHFYMGASNAVPIGAALLGATLLALILSYFNFVLFLVGFVIWLAAAAFALTDLRGGVQSIQGVSLPSRIVGVLLIVAGALLIISLLLPYYRLKIDLSGFTGFGGSRSGTLSGFRSFSVTDILLLLAGLLAVAGGTVSLGLGPVTAAELPSWLPAAVAVAGAVATVLVLFRMFVDVIPGGGSGVDVGRAPGIWIGLWASLLIVLTNLGTLRSLTGGRSGTTTTSA